MNAKVVIIVVCLLVAAAIFAYKYTVDSGSGTEDRKSVV